MTAIDLTRDQCAALADYLKERVELCHQGYDLTELLVLAQRALRNASKGIVDIGLKGAPGAEGRNEPKSGTPEGRAVSAVREVAPARPSGASEAARFKRDTADRLVAYRSKWGPGCMGRLAALCGGDVNADKLTRMCDRERFPVEMWRKVAAALDKLEGGNEDGRQSEWPTGGLEAAESGDRLADLYGLRARA